MASYELGKMRTDRGEFIDKGNYYVDPRHEDFNGGADPTGVRDSRQALAEADEYASALGRPLVLVTGNYRISADLTLATGVSLHPDVTFSGPGVLSFTSLGSAADVAEVSGAVTALDSRVGTVEDALSDHGVDIGILQSRDFNVLTYGAKGDGLTDDTVALQAAAAALQGVGGGELLLPPGVYRVFSTGASLPSAPIFGFTGIAGVKVTGHGATILVDRALSMNEYLTICKLTDVRDFEIEGLKVTHSGVEGWAAGTKEKGARLVQALGGCRNLALRGVAAWGGIGFQAYAPAGSPDSARTKGVTIDGLELFHTAYGINGQFSGDNLTARGVVSDAPHRTYFVYGVRDHDVRLESADQDADDAIIGAYQGYGCENIRVVYTNTKSSAAQLAAAGVTIQYGDPTPAAMRKIDVEYDLVWPASGYFGYGFKLGKYTAPDTTDTADRGHILEGFTLRGRGQGGAGTSSLPFRVDGVWGLGETMRAIALRDVVWLGTANPEVVLDSLQDQAILENVVSDVHVYLRGSSAGSILALGCKALSLCASAADTTIIHYVGCTIGSKENQSFINKTLTRTAVAAGRYGFTDAESKGLFNVKDAQFAGGARGDGVTDDATAIRAAIAAMVAAGGGTVLFPPGVYWFNQNRDTALAGSPGAIEIIDVDGWCLSGYGAKIDFKGDFDRYADTVTSVNFLIQNCHDFRIEGLELDGNADQMTNSSGSFENGSAEGFRIGGCTDGTIVDVRCHHWATDGIYYGLDAAGHCCRRILTQRCRFDHNARGGATPTQIRDSVWDTCEFSYSGVTEGAYGGHAPQFGVDIEPIRKVSTGGVDQNTGNLTFRDCKAEFNVGPAMTAVLVDYYEGYIRVIGGEWSIAPEGLGSAGGIFRIVAPETLVQGVTFHTETTNPTGSTAGYIDLTFGDTLDKARIVYRGCKIYGNAYGMLAQHNAYYIVEDCEFIGVHTAPMTLAFPAAGGTHPRSVFRNNHVFLPAVALDGNAINPVTAIGSGIIEGNVYDTDYAGASIGRVSYAATAQIRNEWFRNPAVYFPNPLAAGAAILSYPYSRNPGSVGGTVFLTPVTQVWNPASLATGAQQSTTVAVAGAAVGDSVIISFSQPLLGTRMWGEVTAAGTVTVYQRNDTGAAVDVVNGTLRVVVLKA